MDIILMLRRFKVEAIVLILTTIYIFRRWKSQSSKVANLFGKHVLITGGSSGIGKSVAIEAAKAGADISIIARDVDKLRTAVKEIEKFVAHRKQRINYLAMDISKNYSLIEQNLHKLMQENGPIHMLFNCAGTAICGTIEQLSIENVQYLISLNLMGTLHVTKALIPTFKSQKEGYITITGSQAALFGIYGYSTYCSTKFALRGLAECLHMELKPYNINITFALPPDTDTPGFVNEEKSKPEATREISQKGGLFKPETVAVQMMKDTLDKKFFSTVGFDGSLLTILCSGMSPASSIPRLIFESILMGILRLVSHYIHYDVAKIVAKHENVVIQ